MRVMMTHHEIASSSRDRIEIDTHRATITHAGEVYVVSQRPDGVLRIEAPGGKLHIYVPSDIKVAYLTARGSCLACASRSARGIDESCEEHETTQTPDTPDPPDPRRGPRIVESPKPKHVQCSTCRSTIEYEPEDLVRQPSIPGSDDVG